MASELLDIQPRELKFLFALKKQSSCIIRVVNKFNDYVAFKVKTTSPKKYCVRPNGGILEPKSFCNFTVTMQAPKQYPPDMICKDKFLVQSTVVPADTTDDEITSKMFVRDYGRYIEEVKLRVVLFSPPNSPILSPINAILKHDLLHEVSSLKDNVTLKRGSFTQNNKVLESKVSDSEVLKPATNFKKALNAAEDLAGHAGYEPMNPFEDPLKCEAYKTVKVAEDPLRKGDYKTVDTLQDEENSTNNGEYRTQEHVKDEEDPSRNRDYVTLNHLQDEDNPKKHYKTLNYVKDEVKPKDAEYEALKKMEHLEHSLKDVNITLKDTKLAKNDEMKSKLNSLESKLMAAEITISKLTDERMWTDQETESLRQELVLLRSKRGDRKVQVGFPFLFVFMVAFVGVVLGYTFRC